MDPLPPGRSEPLEIRHPLLLPPSSSHTYTHTLPYSLPPYQAMSIPKEQRIKVENPIVEVSLSLSRLHFYPHPTKVPLC